MKVGLNATCINARPSGAKQRFAGIYSEVIKQLPDVEFVVYNPIDCQVSEWFANAPNVSARRTPLQSNGRIRKFVTGLGYWRSALRYEAFDIFEGFNQPLVRAPSGQTLLTIHDVRRMYLGWSSLEQMVYKIAFEKAVRTADRVITVSDAMKAEILGFFPTASVSVIYNGLDASKFDRVSESDLQATHDRHGLPTEFVLAVGHYEPRKNYGRLLEALALLRDRGIDCNLVIIGNDSGERKQIAHRVASLHLSDRVTLLSGLSDQDVCNAYKLCKLFVFPSSYEGFGIPILEAMAAGCPMALSDLAVFREIAKEPGNYFRFDDTEAMALAIERGLHDEVERARQVRFGHERVRDFGFEAIARQLVRLYGVVRS